MFDTDVGNPHLSLRGVRPAPALIGWEVHVLVLRMRKAFHRQKFPLCLGTMFSASRERCYAYVWYPPNNIKKTKCRGKNIEESKLIFPVSFLVQLSCKRRGKRSVAIEMLRPPNLTLSLTLWDSDTVSQAWDRLGF